MTGLEKQLKDWASNGLISDEQAQKIISHETKKGRPVTAYIYGFFLLGAVIISIGIISIIAANWNEIPGRAKIFADVVVLSALAGAIYFAHEHDRRTLFEALLVVFILSCLASIGLVAQVYHTGGRPYQAVLLWVAITAMVTVYSANLFVPFIWFAGLLIGLVLLVTDVLWLRIIFEKNFNAFVPALVFLSALLTLVRKAVLKNDRAVAAFFFCTLISWLGAMIYSEVGGRGFSYNYAGYVYTAYLPAYILGVILLAWVWVARSHGKGQKVVLTLTICVFALSFHVTRDYGVMGRLVFAFFTVSELLLVAVYMASIQRRAVFQMLLIFVGIRFMIFYFEALYGLAFTGFGLISSGLMIIGMAYLWYRFRRPLTDWVAGLTR